MLKRQVELNLTGNSDADRIWGSIPERWRRQVVECYARWIGAMAKAECDRLVDKEHSKDDES